MNAFRLDVHDAVPRLQEAARAADEQVEVYVVFPPPSIDRVYRMSMVEVGQRMGMLFKYKPILAVAIITIILATNIGGAFFFVNAC